MSAADRSLPAAVLWDFDGTLVDTEPFWFEAEGDLVRAHGGAWGQEQAEAQVGSNLPGTARALQAAGVDLTEDQVLDHLTRSVAARLDHELPWRPGARELLLRLRERDVRCALVTASYEVVVRPVLSALPAGTFETVVTGEVVEHGKPHPEPYLLAARRLGVAASDCVAIEDSDNGASSAQAAGTRVIVVENHVRVPRSETRTHLGSLAEVWSLLDGA